MSLQRIGKYACLELERRYLLREFPPDGMGQVAPCHITDRYLTSTRLRLRRMRMPGQRAVFKLGQKYQAPSQSRAETTMTNIYLNEAEYQTLYQLEAREVIKKRYPYPFEGLDYSLDVFEGKLTGLILAEIESETKEKLARLPLPAFALKEVTADLFFTGGYLATLTQADFQAGLTKRLGE